MDSNYRDDKKKSRTVAVKRTFDEITETNSAQAHRIKQMCRKQARLEKTLREAIDYELAHKKAFFCDPKSWAGNVDTLQMVGYEFDVMITTNSGAKVNLV